jgi:hypothetical protein
LKQFHSHLSRSIGGEAHPQALLVVGSKDVAGTLRVMDANGSVAFAIDDKARLIQSRDDKYEGQIFFSVVGE